MLKCLSIRFSHTPMMHPEHYGTCEEDLTRLGQGVQFQHDGFIENMIETLIVIGV